MVKNNLAWREAVESVRGWRLTKAEHDAGWPETLDHRILAALQFPYTKGDPKNNAGPKSRLRDITSACDAGELPSTTTTKTVTPAPPRFQQQTTTSWDEPLASGRFRIAMTSATTKPYDVPTYWVTSSAFAAWLATQGGTPSEHIAAWLKANDANSQPEAVHVLASTPATVTTRTTKRRDQLTPLVEAAQKACDNAHDAAAVFLMLKTWAQEDKPRAPLVGVTEDGRIQWRDSNDTPKELNRKSLAKRLKSRSKPPATTPQVKPLRLIK
jgi:hypothetical protein